MSIKEAPDRRQYPSEERLDTSCEKDSFDIEIYEWMQQRFRAEQVNAYGDTFEREL